MLLLKEQDEEKENEGEARGNPRFISQSVTPGLLLLLLLQGLPDPSRPGNDSRREERRVTNQRFETQLDCEIRFEGPPVVQTIGL